MPKLNTKEILNNLKALLKDVFVLLRYSQKVLSPDKAKLIKVFCAKLFSWAIGITLIYITKFALDRGIFAGNVRKFAIFTLAGTVVYFASRALRHISAVILTKIKASFSVRSNKDLLGRLIRLDFLKLRKFSSAENSFIMDYDNSTIEMLVFFDIPSLFSFVKVPVFFVLAFLLSARLSLAAFFIFPVILLNLFLVAERKRYFTERTAASTCRYFSVLHDILLNAKLVKSYFLERWAIGRTTGAFCEKTEDEVEKEIFSERIRFISDIASRIGVSLFWLYGGFLIIKGSITFGTFTAVVMYMGLIFAEAHKFTNVAHGVNQQRFSIHRSAAFIKELPDGDHLEGKRTDLPERFDVFLEGVSFAYPEGRSVLENISVKIKGGKWTLLTGATGSGKSTLMGLIGRLYSPDEGRISFGGIDVRDISSDDLSSSLAVVHQNAYILKDTLINNIFLGEQASEDERAEIEYCSMLEDFVSRLPMGYNTNIDEFGGSISGGERQRVAIARAIARRPNLLILDEATSFVDKGTEKAILSRLKERFPKMTVVMVSHRDSVRCFADNIFELSRRGLRRVDAEQNIEIGEV